MRSGKCLTAAVTSTIAAAVWLANWLIERSRGLTIWGSDTSSLILTAVWAFSALGWWLMWRRERRAAEA